MANRPALGSTVLDTGRTPEEWVALLAERGIVMSARTLREKANSLGARCKVGRVMLITPEHIDNIMMEGQKCRLRFIAGGKSGGSVVTLNTTAPASPTTTAAALAHLQRQAQGNGLRSKRSGKSVVTSLAKHLS